MFWQRSDSSLGNCYLRESSPVANKRESSAVGSSGGRGPQLEGAVSLPGYVPSSALRKVGEREGEN